ncbi:MAG: hypothetical protein ACRDL8_21705 [Solirubrobacteraceae bacterium]
MIRVTGHFGLRTADREAIDAAFDQITDALMLNPSIEEPTVSVDLGAGELLIELIVDTDDALEATRTAADAVQLAFGAAVQVHGQTRVYVHHDLIRADRVALATELVAAS